MKNYNWMYRDIFIDLTIDAKYFVTTQYKSLLPSLLERRGEDAFKHDCHRHRRDQHKEMYRC